MERDQSILLSAFKNKILTTKQVHQFYFVGRSMQATYRRMGKIYDQGFLGKKVIQLDGKCEAYFFITKKGIDLIQSFLPLKVVKAGYKSDSLEHDLKLTELTWNLQGYSVVNDVFSESELQSYEQKHISEHLLPFVHLRSDRVLKIKSKGKYLFIPLEYERTLKNTSRVKEKFEAYYRHEKIHVVLYVCENASMIESLKKVESSICHQEKSKIYFTTLNNAICRHGEVTFTNQLGEKLFIY